MIALKKEIFDSFRKELNYLGILLLALLIMFKIIFFNEDLFVAVKTVLSLFWLFVLPGYFVMFYWHEKLDFIERLVIGTALSAAATGAISYYLGLAGLNIKYHGIFLPLIIISVSAAVIMKKK